MLISVCGERFDPFEEDNDEERVVHPKTDEQRERLAAVVSKMLIFSSLDEVSNLMIKVISLFSALVIYNVT